jgi:D-arabinitol 4-dehydrogenase
MDPSPAHPHVILHLGLGSFHRAHQAAYLNRLIESGDDSWVLAGGNIRPEMADTLAALQAQGGRYTLETVTPQGARHYEQIASIRTVVPFDPTLAGLVAVGADERTRIVSFTVTEAGYYLDAGNRLDLGFDELAADVQTLRSRRPDRLSRTLYGALTTILRERVKRRAGPVTLLNCDNLRHNGERTRAGLLQFLEMVDDMELMGWTKRHATFPNSMVDRITPRPTPELAARVRAATGRVDAAPVMAESFIQWVIEDRFAAGRPRWEEVGVQMVATVDPYEEAKIRILNASHSAIAWAGTLLGHRFIHEGTHDAAVRRIAYDYVTDDVIPVLEPSPIDLRAYRDQVLERFGNPGILDTNQRVAADGFSKIPGFIVPTIRDRLGRGQPIDSVAMLPALFLAYLQRWQRGELDADYQDQAMDPAVARAICSADDPVAALCRDTTLWGLLAGDVRVTAAVREASQRVDAIARGQR